MRFYQIETDIGPQLVTSKTGLKNPKLVEIPTDSKGLMLHLNALMAIKHAVETSPVPPGPAPETIEAPIMPDGTPRLAFDAQSKFGALRSLAIMDAPEGTLPDEVAKMIMTSNGYVLARFAEAVSVRYADLAKSPGHVKKR